MDFYINELFELPIHYYGISVAIALALILAKRKTVLALLMGYSFWILAAIVINRESTNNVRYTLQLFWSYEVWEEQKWQIIANIIMFVPIGILAGTMWKYKAVVYGLFLSIVTETFQLVLYRGLFEFDDMVNNTIGTILGVLLIVGIKKLMKHHNQEKCNNEL